MESGHGAEADEVWYVCEDDMMTQQQENTKMRDKMNHIILGHSSCT